MMTLLGAAGQLDRSAPVLADHGVYAPGVGAAHVVRRSRGDVGALADVGAREATQLEIRQLQDRARLAGFVTLVILAGDLPVARL
jgi:hypothetical protein